ncbi:MAG: hypothetical protein M1839_005996 [Geoglossum umbratile]|nr:MAG: hypothetical protein M1839_005996 [Geoglossum umbratile]
MAELSKPTATFYLAIASLFFIPFITSFNAVVLGSALPAITVALNAPSDKAFWCGTGFVIARTAATPIWGAFSEAFGRRVSLLSALTVFVFAAALCSTARSIDWLLVGRIIQGAAAGGLNAVVGVILTDMVQLRNRGKVTGLFALSQFLGLPGGLVLGGAIAEHATWRLVFLITIPVCVFTAVGILAFLKLKPPEASFVEAMKNLDWIGMAIFTGSIVSLLYGVTTGGHLHPWRSAEVVVPIVFGATGIAGFILFEAKVPNNPMIPPRMFANCTAASGFISSGIHGLVWFGSAFYFIQYFLVTQNHSLLRSAVDCLPGIIVLVVTSAASGFIFSRIKKFQKLMWGAWVLAVVGMGLLSTLRPNSPRAAQYGYQIIGSLGGGIILPGRMLSVQASLKQEDVAMATTIVAFMLSVGQAVGVGVGGNVIQNRWDTLVRESLAKNELTSEFLISPNHFESAWSIMSNFPMRYKAMYQEITAESIGALFIFCSALAGVALLCSFMAEDLSLDKDARSRQRFVGVQQEPKIVDAEKPQSEIPQIPPIHIAAWSWEAARAGQLPDVEQVGSTSTGTTETANVGGTSIENSTGITSKYYRVESRY